jgi:hypothetical protein
MIISLVLSALVAQATQAPIQPFLGVTPPSGYTEVSPPGDPTSRLWGKGDGENAEIIVLNVSHGTNRSTQSYVTDVYIPDFNKVSEEYHVASSRAVTVCGGPGWEIREEFVFQDRPTVQLSLFRATHDYIIEAHYQHSQSREEDPSAVAAIRKLCPAKK